jgi:hypothetical protein
MDHDLFFQYFYREITSPLNSSQEDEVIDTKKYHFLLLKYGYPNVYCLSYLLFFSYPLSPYLNPATDSKGNKFEK